MKTVTVFEARNHFAKTLEAAKKDVIIVTRNGRPVAAIQAIDDDDIEDLLLERSERILGDDQSRPARQTDCDRSAAEASHKGAAGASPAGRFAFPAPNALKSTSAWPAARSRAPRRWPRIQRLARRSATPR